MRLRILLFIHRCALAIVRVSAAADESPLLVHSPTLSKTQIVFVYGGYLWSVPREGGEARQLTTGGHETHSDIFLPTENGSRSPASTTATSTPIVMPAEGGSPRRLTWHPGRRPRPRLDSRQQARALRFRARCVRRLRSPLHRSRRRRLARSSPNVARRSSIVFARRKRIAYVPNLKWQTAWKRYKGGQTTPIYIVQLDDLKLEKVPRAEFQR